MIVQCLYSHLIERAAERCWSEAEVQPCITARDGDNITVDTLHPSYPASRKNGTGSILKSLLKKIGIQATEGCSCDKRACLMDANGPDWCLQNLEQIVGWLRDEASTRGLPFHDGAAGQLVKYAAWQARKAEKQAFQQRPAGT